ncbi:Uncharacterised protein [Klebsiella pneumoniae]|nr:Uncharacterised protein [Klebsiella pneumoniae]
MTSGGNPSSLSAVLAIERKPCDTSTPPKPARLSAALTVWLFIGWVGLMRLGKINSRPLLRDFIVARIARASSDNGIVCSRFIFIRAAGIFHSLASKSISSHLASEASAGRVMVRSCHMNKHRVDILMLAVRIVCISCGSCSGRMLGMFFFCGFSNAFPIFTLGTASIKPVFCA